MPAYFVANQLEITDPEGMDEYRKHVVANIEAAGGKFLVRGGVGEKLEGDAAPNRIVMIEFENMAALKSWYDGEGYTELKQIRMASSRSDIFCVES